MKFLWLLAALSTASGSDLLVAAASDLAPLTKPLESGFGNVRFTLASSGSLARQIENGAPFDVFLSANEQYVHELASSGNIDPSTIVVYAIGRIALWSPDGSVRTLADLRRPAVKRIAIANPEHAPYGLAARQALEKTGLWGAVQPKIVYGENVRQALQFAESGNAEAVITSCTLLAGRGVLIPAELHSPIRQTGGVIKTTANPALARRFLAYLTTPDGQKILLTGGLFPPTPGK